MTACNRCQGPMVPVQEALVPALACTGCGRIIPMTGVSHRKTGRADLNRALRAAQRRKLAEGRARAA